MGLGLTSCGQDHHLCSEWKPLISGMHLAGTVSQGETGPTQPSTERFNLNVSTCLQDGAAGHFLCPAFSWSFDLHMPVSYCGTHVFWR